MKEGTITVAIIIGVVLGVVALGIYGCEKPEGPPEFNVGDRVTTVLGGHPGVVTSVDFTNYKGKQVVWRYDVHFEKDGAFVTTEMVAGELQAGGP